MKKNLLGDAEKAVVAQKNQLANIDESLVEGHAHVERLRSMHAGNSILLAKLSRKVDDLVKPKGQQIEEYATDAGGDSGGIALALARLRAKKKIENSEVHVERKGSDSGSDLASSLARLRAKKELEQYDFSFVDKIDEIDDWDKYIAQVAYYGEINGIDFDINPYIQIFGEDGVAEIQKKYEVEFGGIKWSQSDYAVVGIASIIGILVDFFVVSIPPTNSAGGVFDQVFKGKSQGSSPITKFILKNKNKINANAPDGSLFNKLYNGQKFLEDYAKVPFDVPTSKHSDINGLEIGGFSPHFHRLQSLGHDPLFGSIFGIMDILRGQMTVVDRNGVIHIIKNTRVGPENSILNALMKWVCHILSDIPTTRGLPIPGMPFLQCIRAGSPFSLRAGGPKVSFNDMVRFMYKNGYTLEHFLTMAITPLVIEVIISVYHNVSSFDSLFYSNNYDKKADVKLKSMLALSHSIAMTGNIGKMAMFQWNPTAFNYAQCLKMVNSYFALAKAQRLRGEKIDRHLDQSWQTIFASI